MTPAIRSEFRKFFTTRLWWGMAIGIFVAGAAFAALFGFLLTGDQAGTGGPGGHPHRRRDADRQQRVHRRACASGTCSCSPSGCSRSAPSTATRRSAAHSSPRPSGCGPCSPRSSPCSASARIYGLISLVGSVSVGAVVLTPARPAPFPSSRRPHPGAEPPRPRPVGADRAGHRHPHPQPGGGAAHRGRRRVDRRAAARLRDDVLGVRPREHRPVPALGGDERRRQRGARTARTRSGSSGGRPPSSSPPTPRCWPGSASGARPAPTSPDGRDGPARRDGRCAGPGIPAVAAFADHSPSDGVPPDQRG